MRFHHGVEVSFHLRPGDLPEARRMAHDLSAAAIGVDRETLFIDDAAGVYGYLAEWVDAEPAGRFAESPAVDRLASAWVDARGRPATVRRYTMQVGGFAGR